MLRDGPEAPEPGRKAGAEAGPQALLFNSGGVATQPMRLDCGTQIRLFNQDTGLQNLDVHINVSERRFWTGSLAFLRRPQVFRPSGPLLVVRC